MRFFSTSFLAASVSAVVLAAPALAADLPSGSMAPAFSAPPIFTVIIAAGPEVTPSFPGAKSFTVLPSVHLDYLKPGEHNAFYSPDDSFDIPILNTSLFRAGPAGGFINRRGLSGGNGQFNGLPNVDLSVELGGYVEFWPLQDHLRIRGEILKAVTGSNGLTGTIGADFIGYLGPVELAAGPRVKFGDQRYADSYFSISPAAAAINGLVTPYQANGGLTSAGVFASARTKVATNVTATLFGGWDRLTGSVGASPVATVLGNQNQFTGGITLSYAFNFGGFGILGY